ncbi:DNA topoisomerase I alpha [Striga asiatica]|uniref:DNA topoisomerase I alpha n=1 Tax=Striga asiatica TaxID=4170 RepID=A0A5A7PG71_STRAF|nr:DNA topoisomerase I alpha [Striga asiatica]
MVPARASRSSSNFPILTSFQGSLYCSLSMKSVEKLYRMVILLCDGVLVSNSVCGGASSGGSRSLSKILDLVSHSAIVTGEWYIPGHKLRGFFLFEGEEIELESQLLRGAKLEKMRIGLDGDSLDSSISAENWKKEAVQRISRTNQIGADIERICELKSASFGLRCIINWCDGQVLVVHFFVVLGLGLGMGIIGVDESRSMVESSIAMFCWASGLAEDIMIVLGDDSRGFSTVDLGIRARLLED